MKSMKYLEIDLVMFRWSIYMSLYINLKDFQKVLFLIIIENMDALYIIYDKF